LVEGHAELPDRILIERRSKQGSISLFPTGLVQMDTGASGHGGSLAESEPDPFSSLYGAERARALGIAAEEDVDQLIYAASHPAR
jgi:hypothetical protein